MDAECVHLSSWMLHRKNVNWCLRSVRQLHIYVCKAVVVVVVQERETLLCVAEMVCVCEWDYFFLHYQQWVHSDGCGICSWCRGAGVCVCLCACGYSPWDHCASLRVSGILPRIDPSIYSRHKGKPTQSFTACGSHQPIPVICVWAQWGFTSRDFWGVCGLLIII